MYLPPSKLGAALAADKGDWLNAEDKPPLAGLGLAEAKQYDLASSVCIDVEDKSED